MGISTATVDHADLASWLLAHEIGVDANTLGLAAAAERVCGKLSRRLSRLVSPAGSQAILSRALHLARTEFPFLQEVRAETGTEVCLVGLGEHMNDIDVAEARLGVLAVLGTLIGLLDGFVGEDLTLRVVREVWPALPLYEPGRPGKSDGQEAVS
jgi:hypothetical protein